MQAGFIHLGDVSPDSDPSPRLAQFLASGSKPLVFTQGSTAVHNAGNFYDVSAGAALRLGRRAVLLGTSPSIVSSASGILALPYEAYSQIFPHAAVNVHQGGSGTTGEALRAGRPMLVVPYGWDQPDNAIRLERLGVGLHLPRRRYSIATATAALTRLLEDTSFSARSAQIATQVNAEDGLSAACNAIESLLVS